MLIVSKFRDYYDTASIYGIDKTCVYKRLEQIINKAEKSYERSHWPLEEEFEIIKASGCYKYKIFKYVIGFCGDMYPVVIIYKSMPMGSDIFSFFSNDKLKQFLVDEKVPTRTRYSWYGEKEFKVASDKGMSNFFDQNTWIKLKKYFADHHCPIFVYGRTYEDPRKTSLVLNPSLKKLGFMKVKDPQTAFQEVYMYLSGVLGAPMKPTKSIDDKTMAASKGHDGEFSFKKPPGKRGKNRWR